MDLSFTERHTELRSHEMHGKFEKAMSLADAQPLGPSFIYFQSKNLSQIEIDID